MQPSDPAATVIPTTALARPAFARAVVAMMVGQVPAIRNEAVRMAANAPGQPGMGMVSRMAVAPLSMAPAISLRSASVAGRMLHSSRPTSMMAQNQAIAWMATRSGARGTRTDRGSRS